MRWLTRGGLVAALLVGGAVTWGLGWRGLLLLLAFFVSGSLLTRAAGGSAGQRTWRQVLANGGVAAFAASLGAWDVAAGSLAAATADTWATEIGSFSPWPPRFLTTWTRVPAGTSGGITALGTLGGVAGAAAMAGLAVLVQPRGDAPGSAELIASAGFAGMLADSLLGASLQGAFECPSCAARSERGDTICHEPVVLIKGRRWLDNDGVNLAATLAGAAVALAGRLLA